MILYIQLISWWVRHATFRQSLKDLFFLLHIEEPTVELWEKLLFRNFLKILFKIQKLEES